MTSFFATTFSFIPNRPETVTATLVSSRQKLFSSIVPVILSSDDLWSALCDVGGNNLFRSTTALQDNFLRLFSFSDSTTVQFTQKLNLFGGSDCQSENAIASSVLSKLIDKTRYFNSTIQHLTFKHPTIITFVCGRKLVNLRSIELSSNTARNIVDSDLKLLCNLTLLRKLDLSFCSRISDEGIAHVARLKALEELILIWLDKITKLPPFKDMKSLKKLDIAHCSKLTDDSLDVKGNLRNHPLNSMSLHSCSCITDKTMQKLLNLPNLFTLTISECPSTTSEAGLTNIGRVKYLRNVGVSIINRGSSSSSIGTSGLEHLSSLASIEHLRVSDCNLPILRGIEALSKNITTLDTVHLDSIESLNNECLEHLSQGCSPIRNLRIITCHAFDDEGFAHLADMKHLETLAIEDSRNNFFTGNIGEDRYLSERLKNLSFQGSSYVTDAGLASSLKSLTRLERLSIGSLTHITSKGLETALEAVSSSLKHLEARECESLINIRFFSQLETTESLNLSCCRKLCFDITAIKQDNVVDSDGEVEEYADEEDIEPDEHEMGMRRFGIMDVMSGDRRRNDSLNSIIPPFNLRCLKSLDVSGCPLICKNDYGYLVSSVLAWPVLTSLNICRCEGLERHFQEILLSFPFENIETLAIGPDKFDSLDVQDFIGLVEMCPRLREVSIRYSSSRFRTEIKSRDDCRKIAYVFKYN